MITKITNRKTSTETDRATILIPLALVLFTAMLMMTAMGYAANAGSLTNGNSISVTHNTNCDSNACQTLLCINDNCRSNSSSVLHSNDPCYLPCLPAQPSSKSH